MNTPSTRIFTATELPDMLTDNRSFHTTAPGLSPGAAAKARASTQNVWRTTSNWFDNQNGTELRESLSEITESGLSFELTTCSGPLCHTQRGAQRLGAFPLMHVAERRLHEKTLCRVSRQLIPLIQVDDSLQRNS
jgi:hypothetical protein